MMTFLGSLCQALYPHCCVVAVQVTWWVSPWPSLRPGADTHGCEHGSVPCCCGSCRVVHATTLKVGACVAACLPDFAVTWHQ